MLQICGPTPIDPGVAASAQYLVPTLTNKTWFGNVLGWRCTNLHLSWRQFLFRKLANSAFWKMIFLSFLRLPRPLAASNVLRFSCDIPKRDARVGMSSWSVLIEYQWASAAGAPQRNQRKSLGTLTQHPFLIQPSGKRVQYWLHDLWWDIRFCESWVTFFHSWVPMFEFSTRATARHRKVQRSAFLITVRGSQRVFGQERKTSER
jgi:hypothetical protein